jgi:hypothetical protein
MLISPQNERPDAYFLGTQPTNGDTDWEYFCVWKKDDRFFWNYCNGDGTSGPENGPFETAREAYFNANSD